MDILLAVRHTSIYTIKFKKYERTIFFLALHFCVLKIFLFF